MTKKGYQPLKTKKTLKIIPPNMGSHVHMKKDGYTWEDLDKEYWKGFDTAKTNMEKRITELEQKVENQKSFLKRIKAKFNLDELERKEIEEYLDGEQLAKAKELLKEWIIYHGGTREFHSALQDKTEAFLKEVAE